MSTIRVPGNDFGLLSERLGYQLRRLDLLSMERLAEQLAQIGLTAGRATALAFISTHPGCDQSALGCALDVNRASAMALVNNLVTFGAVERQPGRDRRSNALQLTDTGRRLLAEVEIITAEHDEVVFGGLSASDRATFGRLLREIQSIADLEPSTADPKLKAIIRRVK
jgi:DNA-binding MarR family transcriptional regulator